MNPKMTVHGVEWWREHLSAASVPQVHFVDEDSCDLAALARATTDLGFVTFQIDGIDAPAPSRLLQARPNVYFALTLSELSWRLAASQQPHVTTTYCFNTEKGCAP